MITGPSCRSGQGSQLDRAAAFLRNHPEQVEFITITLGANDLECLNEATSRLSRSCVMMTVPRISGNLATIIRRLRDADPGIRITGMTYYDPLLGLWLQGQKAHRIVRANHRVIGLLNSGLVDAYQAAGVQVADVAEAFEGGGFADRVALPGHGRVPANVARACMLTWFCADPPLGPDIHPNTMGYGIIAEAFEEALALEA